MCTTRFGFVAAALTTIWLAVPSRAADFTWDATGVNTNLDAGGNWVGGTAPDLNSGTLDSATFSASANTAVTIRDLTDPLAAGDYFASMTFDASAPAYTFSNPTGNDVNGVRIQSLGSLTNNSTQTQTYNTVDVSLLGGDTPSSDVILDAVDGNAGTRRAFNINGNLVTSGGGTTSDFLTVNSFGAKVMGDFDVHVAGALVGSGTLQKTGNGTLFLNSDSTATTTVYIGYPNGSIVSTGDGAVRISSNDALGPPDSGGSTEGFTRVYGNLNSGSRLELTNNITVGERIQIYGRQGDQKEKVAILNVSGDNTLNGPITTSAGGGQYNFGAASGSLTITSDINWGQSSNRWMNWYGDGDGEFSGSLTGSGSHNSHPIVKYGNGTLTLSGTANTLVGQLAVVGGTLKIASTAGISFAANSGFSDFLEMVPTPIHAHVENAATFHVADVAGGYTILDTQTVSGNGSIIGTINAADGSTIQPGVNLVIDSSYDAFFYTDAPGKLTISGDLNMSAAGTGANTVWQLGALSTGNPGVDFDQVAVGGNLALGGTSTLTLDFSLLPFDDHPGAAAPNAFWSANRSWKVIDAGGNTGGTNFATLVGGGPFTNGSFSTSVGATPSIAGDANNDGVVDIFDVNVVSAHWGESGPLGDVNGDDMVDIFDVNAISAAWGDTGPIGNLGDIFLNYTVTGGGAAAVPEPSTWTLLALGAVVACWRPRRRGLVSPQT